MVIFIIHFTAPIMENLKSQKIRFVIFEWLNTLNLRYPDKVIASKTLTNDCIIDGERIKLVGFLKMHENKMILPSLSFLKPNHEWLKERYEIFKKVI